MITKFRPKEKKWVVRVSHDTDAPTIRKITERLNISIPVAEILFNRGYTTPDMAHSFITMGSETLEDPSLLMDVDRACDRIIRAIRNKEKILVFGDYDVDGVTSVCTLYSYLKDVHADVDFYIPDRGDEGHGVNNIALERFHEEGVKLIITVDTGITANEEVEHASALGIDFVITDHHECPDELPHACAVVDPHRRDCPFGFKDLAGVGVIFNVICELERHRSGDSTLECVSRIANQYIDLVAIGTVADVMPLRGENRLFVAKGLQMLSHTKRIGVIELMKQAAYRVDPPRDMDDFCMPKVTAGYIGFTLAPRINAVGRLHSAMLAAELFLTSHEQKAVELARELCKANLDRQHEENRICEEAYQIIDDFHDFDREPMIVLESDTWHHGVIGIVASRIVERYGVPCILVSFDTSDSDARGPFDIGKGSGRSIKGFNLFEALSTCSDILPKFGGHELAAGLSICRRDVPRLRMLLCEYARKKFEELDTVSAIEADLELDPAEINMKLASDIALMEPFGAGNPTPVFISHDFTVIESRALSGGKHTKLTVSKNGRSFVAMCFSMPEVSLYRFRNKRVDLLYTVDINEYAGKKTVQLIVKDIRLSMRGAEDRAAELARIEQIEQGDSYDPSENILPDRGDFAAVYGELKNKNAYGRLSCVRIEELVTEINKKQARALGYIKVKFILDIFEEMKLIDMTDDMVGKHITIRYTDVKVDLERSNILRRLRSQQK